VELNVRSEGGASVQLAGSGLALNARAMQPLASGKAMLAIRPEEFDVVSSPVDNSFAARVLNVEYCGHDNIVDVEVAGGLKLIVRTTMRLRVGDLITLAIAPDKALAYPVDAAAGMVP
jgi:putative spermidine/putrescine transport system ATP-binding protein